MNVLAPEAKRRARYAVRLVVVIAGLTLVAALALLRGGGGKLRQDKQEALRIIRSFSVPLKEISGLSSAGQYIFAVGDDEPRLAVLQFTAGTLKLVRTIDFSAPLWRNYVLCPRRHNSICRSLAGIVGKQWEGLYYRAADDTVHVLQESTGSIYVFNRAMTRIVARTMLDFFPDRQEQSARANNSLGEGFVPLADGRILVAKEKFPAALIEFSTRGSKAQGYDPAKSPPAQVDTAALRTLYPRHYWHLPQKAGKHCDLSDVTHTAGKLYGISQTCRRVYQFAALDPNRKQLQAVQSWYIGERIKAPEALVVVNPQLFMVAADTKSAQDNLWLLSTADYRPRVARHGDSQAVR